MNELEIRQNAFYEQLNLSKVTLNNYKSSLKSSFLVDFLQTEFNLSNIFEVTDIEHLWEIYTKINVHPKNIANHRSYSAAIMKYIRFLNGGKRYGKRIDFKSSRN